MGNKIERVVNSADNNSSNRNFIAFFFSSLLKNIKESDEILNVLLFLSIIIPFVGLILYGWYHIGNLSLNRPIDDNLFAHYGDFLGGTAGIALTFVSAILMYRTLNNQIESNKQIYKANAKQIKSAKDALKISKLEIFDKKFQMLLEQYKKNKDNYHIGDDKISLKDIYSELYVFDPIKQEWTRRMRDAVMKYEEIYTAHREMLSVHFRLLYLLFSTIDSSEIDESDKVLYAKLLRGQFSDSELLLLRYNSRTSPGGKMQAFINRYNLLKHLPFLELIESKSYKQIVSNLELSNALNIFYLSLKKWLSEDFECYENFDIKHNLSERCTISFKTFDNHKILIISLDTPYQIGKGGGIKAPAIDRAFVLFNEDQLKDFLIDVIHESVRYSNYEQFNKYVGPLGVTSDVNPSQNYKRVRIVYHSENRIYMTQKQKERMPS